ncbi:NADP-dependent oxidoreductase [Anaeromyxobacter diazotrophicus]|uniref:Oxidoreductase n=1 Tax=Anaeromyxobacter diazotrophicus TaxID=2590199 RepID=A0A7I9VK22_9BACT|nr:NADP-dependent oxidoreductase [Anaeromyxobacter diazotrophicus]GEJ56538.1 oxidoreductase [Anaeromyxobacter diazotrophicus]
MLAVALLAAAAAGCQHEAQAVRPGGAPAAAPALPARMKAARIASYGHPDAIAVTEVDVPAPGPGQVLLEVHASSLNPVDTYIREGSRQQRFPLSLPVTLGYDVAGVVKRLGAGVGSLRVGDEVYGQAAVTTGGSGAFAEYAVAPAARLARKPRNVGFTDAASLPLVGVSALQAVVEYLKVLPGQKVLVHGGGGGIGSVAIQIAKNAGAHVATTATGGGLAFAKELGADEVIDYRSQRFDELLSGYDAAFDTVGGDTWARSFKVLRRGGILVSMTHPPPSDLPERYGVTAVDENTRMDTASLETLARLVEAGIVTPHVDRAYPLDRVREAFEDKERGGGAVRGKIAIVVIP